VDSAAVKKAAEIIRRGGLVAFPTETVYGLGANALDVVAVAKIFEVKRRPRASPLIVHACSTEMARELALEWPEAAEMLARRYWPGPLTLVVRKQPRIPDIVTAGLATAGIRVPAHPLALALIREAGVPVAAPSANPFTGLSPTTAAHVRDMLGDRVDMVLDGGPANVGIESTVLSLAAVPPRLLRPGMVSREDLEALIGPVQSAGRIEDNGAHESPGRHPRHYSPRTPLVLVDGGHLPAGRGVYLYIRRRAPAALAVAMPEQASAYAARLYATLHREDGKGWDWIAVETPPDDPEWAAVRDRLERAAGGSLQ
jgi:L-threonylcarbamoyladenylate synthase